ncbi:LuxR family transcriptional regulator [Nakamurella antarctica]|uniref:LuxR family transcriptional regulator n=1 Tax=Nakamurella antarctica TaxID=1902245 RepID=A0A3G8ZPL3_9ACTN|nr:LuxR family transcriptional regulator [Nakamurella antarctica]
MATCKRCYCRVFTSRDAALVACVAQGYSNAELAKKFSVSLGYVRQYLTTLYRLLAVQNRAELVARTIHLGLLSVKDWPPEPSGADAACVFSGGLPLQLPSTKDTN